MINFEEYLNEEGQPAGTMELVKTDVKVAYSYAKAVFNKEGLDIDKEFPDFKKNYNFAQKQAGTGRTLRKDMPVIDNKDVKKLQNSLKGGHIDVTTPIGKDTNPKNKYPEHLKGDKAKTFLRGGDKPEDGDQEDDKVSVKIEKVVVGKLKPIQKQIYVDKVIPAMAKSGMKKTREFLFGKSTFVGSKDHFIIDGHHRYLSGLLVDRTKTIRMLVIDLPIKDLLPMSLAFGDAVGNKRNA
jgi:hypothetical protein